MSASLKFGLEDCSFRQTLLPHIDVVLQGVTPTGPNLSAKLAHIYSEDGRWKAVEKLQVLVMEMEKQVHGKEHPDMLRSMGDLALMYWNQGWWKEAEVLQVLVVEMTKQVLGKECLTCLRAWPTWQLYT